MSFSKILSKIACAFFVATIFLPAVFAVPTELKAVATASESAAVGERVEFSAEFSENPFPERPIFYSWKFGDGTIDVGEIVNHAYADPGEYVVELTVNSGAETDTVEFPIFVYDWQEVLFVDENTDEQQLAALTSATRKKNILLTTINTTNPQRAFFGDSSFVANQLLEKQAIVVAAPRLIFWTENGEGIDGLAAFVQQADDVDLSEKTVVVTTSGSLDALARLTRGIFGIVKPQQILITRDEVLRDVILADADADVQPIIENQAIAVRVVDSSVEEFNPIAPFSFFVNYLIGEGIPPSVILLVLLLPAIATFVAFVKQVVGITTFGVYIPSVLTLSFIAIGWRLGLAVLLVVVFASIFTRKAISGYRFAYTPRLAIVMTVVSIAIFFTIVLLTWLKPTGDAVSTVGLISAAIFPMLIMSTLAEKFISIQTEKGIGSAVRLFAEMLFVVLVSYFLFGYWQWLQSALLTYPSIVLLFLVVNIFLARFSGLRLSERFRFRDVIKKIEEEE